MSLNWTVSKIPDHSTVCFVDDGKETKLSTLTRTLIFATMHVGIFRITEENATEFFHRCRIYEQVNGAWQYKLNDDRADPKPVGVYIAYEDVVKHIGLSTNAGKLSAAEFNKQIVATLYRDAEASRTNQIELAKASTDAKDTVSQG